MVSLILILDRSWQRTLFGARISILRTRKSVAMRKMQLQLLRDDSKLVAILYKRFSLVRFTIYQFYTEYTLLFLV